MLSPSNGPSLPIESPSSSRPGTSSDARYSPPDSSIRISFDDIDGGFAEYDIAAPAQRKLMTSPTESMALHDIFGTNLTGGRGGESSAVRSEDLHRIRKGRNLETNRKATTNQIEPPSMSPSVESSIATTIDTSSTGTDTRTSPGSSCSSSGWMSPLHMAAQRGHSGIVRVRKQLPNFNVVFHGYVP